MEPIDLNELKRSFTNQLQGKDLTWIWPQTITKRKEIMISETIGNLNTG
jgi:hypothetical protein